MSEKKESMKFSESYIKFSNLGKKELTKEKLKKFMEENPELITYVSARRIQKAQEKLEKFMKSDPIGAQILKEDKQLLKRE